MLRRRKRRRREVQPLPRRRIDQFGERAAHPRVVGVEPGNLLFGHHRGLDQAAVDRRKRERLEFIERPFRPGGRRGFADQDQVLDADAVGAGAVIARFVGQDHAALERCAAELGNARRSLVHRQV